LQEGGQKVDVPGVAEQHLENQVFFRGEEFHRRGIFRVSGGLYTGKSSVQINQNDTDLFNSFRYEATLAGLGFVAQAVDIFYELTMDIIDIVASCRKNRFR
jgi:hypothetical protein